MTRNQNQKQNSGPECLVVGAGLAGLTAAGHLARLGRRAVVVDKAKSVGGRLATRRMGNATLDHGAQFFTVRSELFAAEVSTWEADGIVDVWCHGFSTEDGYPRYRAIDGMSGIARYLAERLQKDESNRSTVITRVAANAIIAGPEEWAITYEAGSREPDEVPAVIATLPVPQTLALMRAGVTTSPIQDELESIEYHRVIAVMAVLDQSPGLPTPGALQQPEDPTFSFVADNHQKGISTQPAVTFHCNHARSAELWTANDKQVLAALDQEIRRYLGGAAVTQVQIKRWRYAGPVAPSQHNCLMAAEQPGPLVLAGDAFAGSKVEGAFLSGRSAAELVHATCR